MAGRARVVSFDRPALGFSPPPRDGNVGLGSAAADSRKALPGDMFPARLPRIFHITFFPFVTHLRSRQCLRSDAKVGETRVPSRRRVTPE